MDFSVIDRAGLSQKQFASLIGVSRITVNTWVMGHFSPGRKVAGRVRTALDLLRQAVKAKQLPVDKDLPQKLLQEQLDGIARALRAVKG